MPGAYPLNPSRVHRFVSWVPHARMFGASGGGVARSRVIACDALRSRVHVPSISGLACSTVLRFVASARKHPSLVQRQSSVVLHVVWNHTTRRRRPGASFSKTPSWRPGMVPDLGQSRASPPDPYRPNSVPCPPSGRSRDGQWWPAASPDAIDRGGTQHRWLPPSLRRLSEGRLPRRLFSLFGPCVFRGRLEASYQMKVVVVALPAVARSVDQSARNGDTEPTNRTLFCRSI